MPRGAASLSSPDDASGGFVPMHERLKRDFSERILLGEWPAGAQLPGEVELAAIHRCAVGTVRKALAALVAEGLLARRPRRGTMVTGRSPEHSLRFFFRYFRLHGADGSLQRSRAVPVSLDEVAASAAQAQRLGVTPGAPLLRLKRLRLVADQPVMSDLYYLPAARVPGFPRDMADAPELLYLALLETWGIRVTAVREEVRAEVATAEDRRDLHLPDPAAVLVIEATIYDQAGAPCLEAVQRARTDAHRYVNEVR